MDRYWERFKTPFLCFAGFSGVGKTTLLERMIQRFQEDKIRVGYYKHDAHRFQMDKTGKDTERCRKAGAGIVTINDPEHFAVIAENPLKKRTITHALEQCDCILIEGYKKSPFDKIVFLDHRGRLPIPQDDLGIRALIHQGVIDEESIAGCKAPRFHRDEVDKIYSFVRSFFIAQAKPLMSAIFMGGQSKRMGQAKHALSYNGRSEPERLIELLKPLSETVCLSCRSDQDLNGLDAIESVKRVNDEHLGMGPVGGLATLMGRYPDRAWLITACDMPFLGEDALSLVVDERNPLRYGTCFLQKGRLGVEPMCAIYEPKFIVPLFEALSRRELSLSRIMNEISFKHIRVSETNPDNFTNVNTPKEYELARSKREREGA